MSAIEPLPVSVELPHTEMIDHEGALLVRCQDHRGWIPLADYYSEVSGALLPLVGNAVCTHEGCDWKETVRIIDGGEKPAAEGGTLAFNVEEHVGTQDKMV